MENKLSLMLIYNISAEELFLIELLFLASVEENHPEYLIKYLSLKTNNYLFYMLESFKSKQIIENELNEIKIKCNFNPESIIFNKGFLFKYKRYSNELGQEFLSHYPPIAIINGDPYDMHNIAKKYNNYEEFCFSYGKAIGWKQEKHNEIIKLLDWAKQNKCNLINVNVANFVINRAWDKIQLFKDNTYDELIIDTLRDV